MRVQGRIEIGPFGGESKSARRHQAFLVTADGRRLLLRRYDGPSMRDESLEAMAGQEVVAEGLLREDLLIAKTIAPALPASEPPGHARLRRSPRRSK